MKSKAVIRKGSGFRIDCLAVKRELDAGTLSEGDRAIVERILPGLIGKVGERPQIVSDLRKDGSPN